MLFSVWEEYVDFVNKKIFIMNVYLVLLICNYFIKRGLKFFLLKKY